MGSDPLSLPRFGLLKSSHQILLGIAGPREMRTRALQGQSIHPTAA